MLTLNSQKTERGLLIPAIVLMLAVVLAIAYVGVMLVLPAPKPLVDQTIESSKVDTGELGALEWPKSQQAALGMVGYETIITSSGQEKPLPIASVAKVITALAVLKQKPLELDQQGPEITLSAADVSLYNSYRAKGGSVVKVTAGEKISQYQALQAMLIPSSNNMASSLVTWAFGSEEEYVEYANKMVADLGLKNTRVADASGFSPNTVSTASELVIIGKLALKNPVIAQITSQSEATIPTAGKITTTNAVLGKSGIIGMKTGHTAQSGGCFLFAAVKEAGGKKMTVIGVVLAAPTIDEARASAPSVVEQGFANIVESTALGESVPVATVVAPWADPVLIVSRDGLSQSTWKGVPVALDISLSSGDTEGHVGTATLGTDKTDLVMQEELPQPDIWWRLTHPIDLISAL